MIRSRSTFNLNFRPRALELHLTTKKEKVYEGNGLKNTVDLNKKKIK